MEGLHFGPEHVREFWERGFVRAQGVFDADTMDGLEAHLDMLIRDWALTEPGWSGPWRRVYMDEETEAESRLTSLHDLQLYSAAWLYAVTHPRMAEIAGALLGPNVELHHTTLHVKPPETGHPFPLHQDNAFYGHETNRFIAGLVHLDDTGPENGEIRFVEGSHLAGAIEHVTETETGPCTPHLPTDLYPLEDTVPAPAKRGDVVFFNIFTVHGSDLNRSQRSRRMVRCGYRDPDNRQLTGQSLGRPGIMVRGMRPRHPGDAPFATE